MTFDQAFVQLRSVYPPNVTFRLLVGQSSGTDEDYRVTVQPRGGYERVYGRIEADSLQEAIRLVARNVRAVLALGGAA